MNIQSIIRSQFHAALDMFEAAIEACPEELWDRPEDRNRTWHVAYHTLFYVHFYLQPTESDFRPWGQQLDHYRMMGKFPWPPQDEPEIGEALPRAGILEYLAHCREEVDRQTASLDLEAESGFPWLPMNKLELQFYSLRHTMQHVGELYERLGKAGLHELPWRGMGAAAKDPSEA
jgi:hypothetical protein